MASSSVEPPQTALSGAEPWLARSGCHENLRPALENAVNAHPAAWRDLPVTGEVFESLVEAEKRLRVYSLVQGFDIVRRGGGNKVSPASIFQCIHHGTETLNTRALEERVSRDQEGK